MAGSTDNTSERTTPPGDDAAAKEARREQRAKDKMAAQERMRQAVELRTAGISFPKIAETLGYANASGAHHAIKRAMNQLLREPVAELIEVELARLDKLQSFAWAKAQAGDTQAIHAILAIMRRRAEMLGADSPKKVDITATLRKMAEAEGLDPDEAVREAEQFVKEMQL